MGVGHTILDPQRGLRVRCSTYNETMGESGAGSQCVGHTCCPAGLD